MQLCHSPVDNQMMFAETRVNFVLKTTLSLLMCWWSAFKGRDLKTAYWNARYGVNWLEGCICCHDNIFSSYENKAKEKDERETSIYLSTSV